MFLQEMAMMESVIEPFFLHALMESVFSKALDISYSLVLCYVNQVNPHTEFSYEFEKNSDISRDE